MKFLAPSITATLALTSSVPVTLAWGSFGHQLIAYVASEFVSDKTESFCQDILSDRSAGYLANASTWADSFRASSAGRFSAPFHYIDAQDNPPSSCGVDLERDCGEEGCVVSAIANYTERIRDETLPPIDINQALKFLIHFVGDVHQPLHDENLARGGNSINVTFDGTRTNLHHVWDTEIPEKWAGGKTIGHAEKTASMLSKAIKTGVYKSRAKSWLKNLDISAPSKTAMFWAKDANSLVCTTVLKDGVEAALDEDLGGAYFETASPIVQQQLAKAGYRLGAWLNLLATVALNNWDFDTFLAPCYISPNFTKHLGPQSISTAPQTREQWHQDLTSRFVGQPYKEWRASVQYYCEDLDNRRAMAWCTEIGLLEGRHKYEMDYIVRYEFDEDGKLEKLSEYTDSNLQKRLHMTSAPSH
ncbi:MAG: hypothetical protein M1816_007018 [Peltula sp. TS41687]|nr:MAG: hypothetical protein M1816_007018 [Peltula sp. TS41687]